MIAIPAIDLRDGCCVQLVGGSYDDERVRLPDPVAAAERWIDAGFRRLHVVDLDAATGRGSNIGVVERLLALGADIQVGGGIRTTALAERLVCAGATRLVVGTRAFDDTEWLASLAERWPDRVIVAADTRRGAIATHGWTMTGERAATDAISGLTALPLAGFLVTAIDREGQLAGPDLELIANAVRASTRPIVASGGIGAMHDLVALEHSGAAAAVIGMALYCGALDASAVAREFDT